MLTVNRVIALRIVPLLAWIGVSPNAVTLLGLATGIVAATCFGDGREAWLAGALWLQASFILDNCDGSLARRLGRTSGFGSWLDTVSDCIVNMALFFAIGVGLYDDSGHVLWIGAGVVACVGVLFSYAASFAVQVHRRGDAAWRHPDPPAGSESDGPVVGFRKRAREDFSWIVLAAVLLQQLEVLLWAGLVSSFAIGWTNVRAILAGPAGGEVLADERVEVG